MDDELKSRLQCFTPMRVVLRLNKDGKVEGLTENSFDMGWSANRVRIWWSGKAFSMLGEHDIDGVQDAEYNRDDSQHLIFDPLADDCPVFVDWGAWWSAMQAGDNRKYDARNAIFLLKPHGTWQMRALVAEVQRDRVQKWFDGASAELRAAEAKLNAIDAVLRPPPASE